MSQSVQQELDEYRKTLKHVRKLFEEDGTITQGEQDQLNALSRKIDELWKALAAQDDLVARVLTKLKSAGDPRPELAELLRKDMRTVLDVITKVKQAGKLEDFADHITPGNTRLGAAVLTIRPDFDLPWRQLVAKLNEADRKAVLERTPDNIRKTSGFGSDPAKPAGKGEHEEGPEGTVSIGPSGVTVQATLSFKSDLAGELGTTEFSVALGPDGKLSAIEVDLTLIKRNFKKLAVLTPMLDLEGSLSLNAEAELNQKQKDAILERVHAAVKAQIQVGFKEIKGLRRVKFKLSLSRGSGGFSVGGTIEFPIPGS